MILKINLILIILPIISSLHPHSHPPLSSSELPHTFPPTQYQHPLHSSPNSNHFISNAQFNHHPTNPHSQQLYLDQKQSYVNDNGMTNVPIQQLHSYNLPQHNSILNKINQISINIQQLKSNIHQCTNCPNLQSYLHSLHLQSAKLTSLTSTLQHHADIASVASGLVDLKISSFKDNLKAINWFHSQNSQQQYKRNTFQRSKRLDLTSCPIDTPYVNQTTNTCFDCKEGGAYNLSSKSCLNCPIGSYFQLKQLKCTGCDEKQVYSKKQKKCIYCPKGYIFTPNVGCQARNCYDQKPFFNSSTGKCQPCPPSTVFDEQRKECKRTNFIGTCPNDKPFYNQATEACEKCQEGFIYNANTYKCDDLNALKCTVDQTYNQLTKLCVETRSLCTSNEYYDEVAKRCLKLSSKCKVDEVYNRLTKRCVPMTFITSPYVFNLVYPGKQFASYIQQYEENKAYNQNLMDCPMNKPYFSTLSFSCIKCGQDTPLFDLQNEVCIKCPQPSFYDPTSYKCVSNTKHD